VTDAILQRFGAAPGDRIGHGGEATVYALSGERVLRVFHTPHGDIARIASFYDELAGQDPGFALPRVLEYGEIEGAAYSVDRRMPGRPMMDVLPELAGDRRRTALDAYLSAAEAIGRLRIARPFYGEIMPLDPIQRATWRAFLHGRVEASLVLSRAHLSDDVPALDDVLAVVHQRIDALPVTIDRRLVHGDYFPGNVMIGDDLAVSGVIDFGSLTLIGDPLMDVSSAIVFLEAVRPAFVPEDAAYLTERAVSSYGADLVETMRTYRAYYALRLSHSKTDDPWLYAWCVRSLEGLREH
jgi:aminoglycoside phosphotransferase (APT) family kinase protein